MRLINALFLFVVWVNISKNNKENQRKINVWVIKLH